MRDKLLTLTENEVKFLYWKCRGFTYIEIGEIYGHSVVSITKYIGRVYTKLEFDKKLNQHQRKQELLKQGGFCQVLSEMVAELMGNYSKVDEVFEEWPPDIKEPEPEEIYWIMALEDDLIWQQGTSSSLIETITLPSTIPPQASRWRAYLILFLIGIVFLGLLVGAFALGQNYGLRTAPVVITVVPPGITVAPPPVTVLANVPDVTVVVDPTNQSQFDVPLGGPISLRYVFYNFESNNATKGWSVEGALFERQEEDGNHYLYIANATDETTAYLTAPKQLLGNWRSFATLQYDLKIIYEASQFGIMGCGPNGIFDCRGDVILTSGDKYASYRLPIPPSVGKWTTISVPLDTHEGWSIFPGGTELNEILSNVTKFEIRTEYGYNPVVFGFGPTAEDIVGLDNLAFLRSYDPVIEGLEPLGFWERLRVLFTGK